MRFAVIDADYECQGYIEGKEVQATGEKYQLENPDEEFYCLIAVAGESLTCADVSRALTQGLEIEFCPSCGCEYDGLMLHSAESERVH